MLCYAVFAATHLMNTICFFFFFLGVTIYFIQLVGLLAVLIIINSNI